MTAPALVCTVAGSDSSAGAGIQADLRTFAMCGVYGTTVVTAVTAQDTTGVHAVETVSPELVAAQIDAIAKDLGPLAWKAGMLATAPIVEVVAERLRHHRARNLVVDPVLVATGGQRLLDEPGLDRLRRDLLPRATVVTPNLDEAVALLGASAADPPSAREAARRLTELGPRLAVVTGGDGGGDTMVDTVHDAATDRTVELRHLRLPGGPVHGSGCVHSAAIAAHLARGLEPLEAVAAAAEVVQDLLAGAQTLGRGQRVIWRPASGMDLL
jgi:hydroxymethylpyrimidine/phosphomethylpyrimidine kinase